MLSWDERMCLAYMKLLHLLSAFIDKGNGVLYVNVLRSACARSTCPRRCEITL